MSLLPVGQTEADRSLLARLTWRDWRPTLVAAGLTAVAVAILIVAFDSVSAFERPVVLASLTTSILWIAAALITACGAIAALMLTAVSLLDRLETRRLPPRVLVHLRLTLLGALSTIAFAVGALLVTTFPVAGGVDVQPPAWQIDAVFFALLGLTAVMVGAFAVVLTSLYATVTDVLQGLPEAWVEDILAEEADRDAALQRPSRRR
jgi:MFS family permease